MKFSFHLFLEHGSSKEVLVQCCWDEQDIPKLRDVVANECTQQGVALESREVESDRESLSHNMSCVSDTLQSHVKSCSGHTVALHLFYCI